MRVLLSTEETTIELSAPGGYQPDVVADLAQRALDMLLTVQAADRIVAADEARETP